MDRRASRFVVVALLGAPLSFASIARADPTGPDRAAAEVLFRTAKELLLQGKVADACPKLVESNRLDPKPGTLLNVAACHEQQGLTASAWADYADAATMASKAGQSDREKYARKKNEDLEKKLSRVKLTMQTATADVEVKLDGRTMGVAVLGADLPIDPGAHTLDVTAPQKKPWEKRFEISAEGGTTTPIDIPKLEDVDVAAPIPAPPPPTQEREEPRVLVGMKPPPLVTDIAFGVGVVGLGLGTYFGVRAFQKKSDVDLECAGNACTPAGLSANDAARTDATISTVSFIAGGAAIVAGAVLWWIAPSPASRVAWVSPEFGPKSAGISAGGVL